MCPNSTGNRRPKICYYPVFTDVNILNDHVARAAWYLSCMHPLEIVFIVGKGIEPDFQAPSYFDESVSNFIFACKNKIRIIHVKKEEDGVQSMLNDNDVDIFMLWNQNILEDGKSKRQFDELRNTKPFWKVDNSKIRFEGSFYIKAGLENLPEKDECIEAERKKFIEKTREFNTYKKSYVFCTGPNVSKYRKHEYSDGLSIICNSIIFDDDMMEYINPKVLCFADPIFHFGPSRYAAEFFKKLREVLQHFDLLIVIPFNFYRIARHNYPELKERIITVPIDYDRKKPLSYDLKEDFYVNPFGSVLHLLMLPMASTFTQEIYILGADGKKETDNKYFWSHNKKTQINDQMTNIQVAHPSFFNINYTDFYENHKMVLNDYISSGEQNGRCYQTLTPSYIPCLKERHHYDKNIDLMIDKVVCVYDPDFRDYGHNVYFNIHVANVLSHYFSTVLVLDENKIIDSAFNDKPSNVKILQIPSMCISKRNELNVEISRLSKQKLSAQKKKEGVKAFEYDFFKNMWEFIDNNGCEILFLTSEAKLGSSICNSMASFPPKTPYFIFIHIVWALLRKINDIDLMGLLQRAEGIFVLEDYLRDESKSFNKNIYKFPYVIYDDHYKLPQKKNQGLLKIGTVGVINERRNIPFILSSLEKYDGPPIEYHLCGMTIGDEGDLVEKLAGEFANYEHVKLKTNLKFLSEEEFFQMGLFCDFMLIAYDECRKYQAPGVLYQFTKCGTPIIAPNIEPFTIFEKKYPGLFIFYDSLSSKGLNNCLRTLAFKGLDYESLKADALKAMNRFMLDNSEKRQLSSIYSILCKLCGENKFVLPYSRTKIVLASLLNKLSEYDNRIVELFNIHSVSDFINNEIVIEKSARDEYIQRISEGSNIFNEIISKNIIDKIFDFHSISYKLSRLNVTESIIQNEDILLDICPSEIIEKSIFCSRYNIKSRSDKYHGFWGKLFGAYEIHKAACEYESTDKPRLTALKDKHKGQRGFVICNGPSLNEVDFDYLKNEITIGTNGLYLMFENRDFRPTYYLVEDVLIAEDRRDDLNNKINGPLKFFAQRLAYCIDRADDVIFLRHNPDLNDPWFRDRNQMKTDMPFSKDISLVTYGGNTVTYTCLQIMLYLGIREVYIIGADHNYEVPDRYNDLDENENYVIDPQEEDVNHFNPSYFGKGYRWHNPKVHKLEQAYTNARNFYEYHGAKIYNATIGGQLEVFERVNFYDLFDSDQKKQRMFTILSIKKTYTKSVLKISLLFRKYRARKFTTKQLFINAYWRAIDILYVRIFRRILGWFRKN